MPCYYDIYSTPRSAEGTIIIALNRVVAGGQQERVTGVWGFGVTCINTLHRPFDMLNICAQYYGEDLYGISLTFGPIWIALFYTHKYGFRPGCAVRFDDKRSVCNQDHWWPISGI